MQRAAPHLHMESIFINILLGRHMHKQTLWLVQGQKPKRFEKQLDWENNQIKPVFWWKLCLWSSEAEVKKSQKTEAVQYKD